MLAQTLGWIATFLFTVCYIPQIVKTIRSKTLGGLSVTLFVIQIIANIDALAYATLINQRPLQIKYTLALIMLSMVLFAIYRIYVRNRPPKDSSVKQSTPSVGAASSRTEDVPSASSSTLSRSGTPKRLAAVP